MKGARTTAWRQRDGPIPRSPIRRGSGHARDDNGDGVREVHDNTMEGVWTGIRHCLRPFRGISKWYLSQYIAIFEWTYNLKRVTAPCLRAMMVPCTSEPT